MMIAPAARAFAVLVHDLRFHAALQLHVKRLRIRAVERRRRLDILPRPADLHPCVAGRQFRGDHLALPRRDLHRLEPEGAFQKFDRRAQIVIANPRLKPGHQFILNALTDAANSPTPGITARTRSPARIRAPFGQPVEIRSPGYSVMNCE